MSVHEIHRKSRPRFSPSKEVHKPWRPPAHHFLEAGNACTHEAYCRQLSQRILFSFLRSYRQYDDQRRRSWRHQKRAPLSRIHHSADTTLCLRELWEVLVRSWSRSLQSESFRVDLRQPVLCTLILLPGSNFYLLSATALRVLFAVESIAWY